MRTLRLPGRKDHVNPGDVCGVAGWGKTSINANKGSALLEEAELIIQGDAECKKRFRHYSETTEICAGDPNEIEAPSKVGNQAFHRQKSRVKGSWERPRYENGKPSNLSSEKRKPKTPALVSYVSVARVSAGKTSVISDRIHYLRVSPRTSEKA